MRNITLSGRHHLKELGRDGKITFKWNLRIRMWIVFIWVRIKATLGLS
jgi:hypothetical protein